MAENSVEKSRHAKSDLNRADRDELVSVPGIGPAVAESILKQRSDRGGFKSLDELSDVTGIGAQTVQNLRERFNISRKRAAAAKSASKGDVRKGSGADKTAKNTSRSGAEARGHRQGVHVRRSALAPLESPAGDLQAAVCPSS